ARKIDETESPVLEQDAELLELALKAVDLARERLCIPFQLLGAAALLAWARGRRDQIELEDLLTPQTMLAHDILDDFADQRQRPVRLFDGEQLHVREEVNVVSFFSRD